MKNDIIYNKFNDFLETYKDYLLSNEEIWNNNLEKVIEYIKENNKLPPISDTNKEIKSLGVWISTQKRNYKKRNEIMKNDIIYNKFKDFLEKYNEYFILNGEVWNNNLEKVIQYIDENNKLPSQIDNDKYIKSLGSWLSTQKQNYKIRKEIMKNDIIYNNFKDFIEKYKEYFISNEEVWNNNLETVIKYIDMNNKLPSLTDNNKIKSLSNWLNSQLNNYKTQKDIMKNDIIYNKFKNFLEIYKEYFLSNKEIWNNNLEKIIEYIKKNNKLPSKIDKDKEIKILGLWISTQKTNYKNIHKIMKDDIIYNKFKDFLEIYKEYFLSNEELWHNNLEKVIEYIDMNNKLPFIKDTDIYIKTLAMWIHRQKINYKIKKTIMKDDTIYNKWTEFINNHKYKKYF
jgi:hypothetical protein